MSDFDVWVIVKPIVQYDMKMYCTSIKEKGRRLVWPKYRHEDGILESQLWRYGWLEGGGEELGWWVKSINFGK